MNKAAVALGFFWIGFWGGSTLNPLCFKLSTLDAPNV